MKPLKLSEENKAELMKLFIKKFEKELEDFTFNLNDTKISISAEFSKPAKEKIQIIYTASAYLRMKALVDFYNTEVSWYGLVKKLDDKKYYVYDVKVYKQYVNGSKVDTDDEELQEWKDTLSDDEINAMFFQAHSHVNMSTGASGTDLQNQADIVKNMGKHGFMIFQIWNKSGDINTYLYDIDGNMFYDKKDVEIDIEDEAGLLSDFVASTEELVTEKKLNYYVPSTVSPKGKGKVKKMEYEPSYLPGYWDGNSYYERGWDW